MTGIDKLLRDIATEVHYTRDLIGRDALDPRVMAAMAEVPREAFVPADEADLVLAAMRTRPEGAGAVVVGRCVAEHPGVVAARTALGGTRVVSMPMGEQLPRIC